MDRPFIKKMCNAYYNDHDLRTVEIWKNKEECSNELFESIVYLIEELKLEDMETYHSLFEMNRQKQYGIIYRLIDDYLVENYADENLLETISYDEFSLGPIEEAFGVDDAATAFTIIGMAATFGYVKKRSQKYVSKAVIESLAALGRTSDRIHKYLSKKLGKYKIKKAILYDDYQGCMKVCGIRDFKDFEGSTAKVVAGHSKQSSLSTEGITQAKCLINCYLSSTCTVVENLASSYKECMNRGATPVDNKTLLNFLKTPTNEFCKVYYDDIIKHKSQFEEAIKYLSRDDDALRLKWTKDYIDHLERGLGLSSNDPKPKFPPSKGGFQQRR